jgi:hypothetical protein
VKNVFILVIALLTAIVPSARGQETTGAIAGRVVGPDQSALPGVTVTVTGAQGVKTASAPENQYLLDGVNITNGGYGALASYSIVFGSRRNATPYDFIEQVQVKTGGYEAELGQATGGVINVVTKSGSHAFNMISQPAHSHLNVALAFDAGAAPAFEAAVAEEAARVWAPYGIALDESPADSPCHSGSITLHVAMAQTPDPGTNPHALGSIVFTGGAPEPSISLYVATAADLVSIATRSDPSHWPVAYRDVLLSRVLGRALAHEIGHYVLNARTHSESGLMRAVQPVTELMEFRDTNLALSPADAATLCKVLMN